MKFADEIADVWAGALSSSLKRVAFFWSFIVAASLLGQLISRRSISFGDILLFGGLTHVLIGPLFVISTLTAAILWIRFIHLDERHIGEFCLFGAMIATNAALGERPSGWLIAFTNLAAIGIIAAFLLQSWRKRAS